MENITPSYLSFRKHVNTGAEDMAYYPQDEHEFMRVIYGMDPEGPGLQEVGSIEVCEGRLIAFPNILQHLVRPFKLADPTKPGHRKILALFLVDPKSRVISTANVPCQRSDWWAREINDTNALPKLPSELRDLIVENVDDFPISMKEAKVLREELMNERRAFVTAANEGFEMDTFSLCEH
jgi:hypothetical protein